MRRGLQLRICSAIRERCAAGACCTAVLEALARPGFALHHTGSCRAGLLTLEAYRALGGPPPRHVLDAAAGVELYMTAGYLLDNVADAEVAADAASHAQELALAIVSLTCGAALVARSGSYVGFAYGRTVQDRFHYACTLAATGQFFDARFQGDSETTPRQALLAACLKAGSLGRMAAGLGAALATRNVGDIRGVERFGFNLFTYAQLIDDVLDAAPRTGGVGDFARRGSTLPVVYYRRNPPRERLRGTMTRPLAKAFEDSGALLFGRVVAGVFLQRARRCLQRLAERHVPVGSLNTMLEQLIGSAAS